MRKHGITIRLNGFLLYWALRLHRLSWRIHIEGREHFDQLCDKEKRSLLCFWHGKYIPIFPILEGHEAWVVTNQSKRGTIIAEICRNLGYQTVQLPDQTRRDTLSYLEKALAEAYIVGTAVDGPLGPRNRVKSGVIRLGSTLGFDLLPVSVDSRRKIVLHRRWDRMEIPLPFTTVHLVFGEPIEVPSSLRNGQIRELSEHLAREISKLDERAKELVAMRKDR